VTGFAAAGAQPALLGAKLAEALAACRNSSVVGPIRAAADAAAARHRLRDSVERTVDLYEALLAVPR
jgi:hypothetical protein